MTRLIGLFCGTIFGAGLAISGMTNTHIVLNFFDVLGQWDPSLGFVMGAAVGVSTLGFHWVLKKKSPWFGDVFHLPTATIIDRKLIGGALLFGAGWGISGYCPGPGFSSLVYLYPEPYAFVTAMALGIIVHKKEFK